MVSTRQLDTFSAALRARVLDRSAGFSKRYLRQFVSEIRFDGKRVVMRGKKAALLVAAAQKEMDTTGVPIIEPNWLLNRVRGSDRHLGLFYGRHPGHRAVGCRLAGN